MPIIIKNPKNRRRNAGSSLRRLESSKFDMSKLSSAPKKIGKFKVGKATKNDQGRTIYPIYRDGVIFKKYLSKKNQQNFMLKRSLDEKTSSRASASKKKGKKGKKKNPIVLNPRRNPNYSDREEELMDYLSNPSVDIFEEEEWDYPMVPNRRRRRR
jgi:hypothetical protein